MNRHLLYATPSALVAFCRVEVYLAAMVAGEGVAILLALAPGVEGDRWARLGLASLFVQWVMFAWVALLCAGRRMLSRANLVQAAWIAVAALVLVSIVVGGVSFGLLGGLGVDVASLWLFLWPIAAVALVVGVVGVMGFYAYLRVVSLALKLKEAELAALHARIRPHFLFNTLNSIASLIPGRPQEAEAMVESLAGMLRAALAGPGLVTLADELALVRAYLSIEAARLEGRLRVVWSGDVLANEGADAASLRAVMVPSLSIQPLVENAVRYGVEPAREGGTLEIAVSRVGDDGVMVRVSNALLPLASSHSGAGMALSNVRSRVEGVFPGRGRVDVSREDGVFEVRLVVPG